MTFRQLMQYLEQTLGHHQVPINEHAASLRDLFDSCALHHDLTLDLSKEIYRANRCHHLSGRITRAATLEALAPIRLKVLRASNTDVDTASYIEEACAAVSNYFDQQAPESERPHATTPRSSAEVIPLSSFRSRRMKSLA